MIIDCFTFFDEFDILKLRLETLKDVVDEFHLIEADATFTGEKKPYYFDERKKEFKDYPIIAGRLHLIGSEPWERERRQRNAVVGYLPIMLDDSDLILLSDVDEIPRPELLPKLAELMPVPVMTLEQNFYYYYLNTQVSEIWKGTVCLRRSALDQYSPEEIRLSRWFHPFLRNAGWHFSFLGDPQWIRRKIKSFSHTEFDQSKYTAPERIAARKNFLLDPFDRDKTITRVEIDDSYPSSIRDHQEELAHLILS